MRRLPAPALALAALALLFGCKNGDAGKASSAELRWTDAGAEIALGARLAAIPAGELADGARPSIVSDDSGKRFAYPTKAGDVRLLYRVGENVYLGQRMAAPIDFKRAPDLDAALGALFENASHPARATLLADVASTLGDAGIAKLLVESATSDAPEWDDAYAKLPEARRGDVSTALAPLLERGKPIEGLRRVVTIVPLREPARASILEERIRELSDPPKDPASVAVMLRALSVSARSRAAAVACDVLAHLTATKPARFAVPHGPSEDVTPARDLLAEAALLAIASDVYAGAPLACTQIDAALAEPCVPEVRCAHAAPLTGRETSLQDEPLCTKNELVPIVARELDRAPSDVLAGKAAVRSRLFAFAAALGGNKVPANVTRAHARRRYAISQPKEPLCESGIALATPCHCDEATVRDQACEKPESAMVRVGVCQFEVDDKQKKIQNVILAPAP